MKRGFEKSLCFAFIFAIMLFSFSLVSAAGEDCSITDRSSCTSSGGTVVMGLSSESNAHGELASEGNYDNVLCCNFAGTIACNGNNKIVGLSDSTNAHAEIPNGTTYTGNDVCYEGLTCISTQDTLEDMIGIFSLSGESNAHIGAIGEFNTNIYCSYVGSSLSTRLFWTNTNDEEITQTEVIPGTTKVKLIFNNSDLTEGTPITLDIYENDLFLDDFIRSVSATVDADGKAVAEWTITLEDLQETTNDYEEFYFQYGGEQTSFYLEMTIMEVSECENIAICGNYEGSSACGNDICNVAETSNPNDLNCDDPNIGCSCSWNTDDCEFEFNVFDEETQETIGTCTFDENTEDDCSDGLLSYSWTTSWTGLEENRPGTCVDGEKVLECPAQIQLPAFGVYNLLIALASVMIIYLALRMKGRLNFKKIIKKYL